MFDSEHDDLRRDGETSREAASSAATELAVTRSSPSPLKSLPLISDLGESLERGAPTDTASVAQSGERCGMYRLLHSLGHGGMGIVRKGWHTVRGHWAAVKTILPAHRANRLYCERFRQEISITAGLSHPHIVKTLEFDDDDVRSFLVLELLDGFSLDRLADVYGSLPISDAYELVRQAATALSYLHQRQVVHRDVKPANLFLTSSLQVKLIDFGLAERVSDPSNTVEVPPRRVMGTPQYMAPEQICGRVLDERVDIYGLGCVSFKLLTGVSPSQACSTVGATTKSLCVPSAGKFPDIRLCRADVPAESAAFIQRMLAAAPETRPSATETAAVFSNWIRGTDIGGLFAEAARGSAVTLSPGLVSTLVDVAQ